MSLPSLVQNTLTSYLDTLDVPIEEFYKEVREVQDDSADPYLKQFVKCLLASADYESFYRVMSREGSTYKAKRIRDAMRSSKDVPLEEDEVKPEKQFSSPKAEAKGSLRSDEFEDDQKGSKSDSSDMSAKDSSDYK